MARRDRDLEEKLLQVIADAGGVVLEKGSTKGGHRRLVWSLPSGQTRKAIYASTFGNVGRTYLNTIAMIKRMCKTGEE